MGFVLEPLNLVLHDVGAHLGSACPGRMFRGLCIQVIPRWVVSQSCCMRVINASDKGTHLTFTHLKLFLIVLGINSQCSWDIVTTYKLITLVIMGVIYIRLVRESISVVKVWL